MTRKNPRRPSAQVQFMVTRYLTQASSMRLQSRPSQIRAAAKKIQRSGSLPAPVVDGLRAIGLVVA